MSHRFKQKQHKEEYSPKRDTHFDIVEHLQEINAKLDNIISYINLSEKKAKVALIIGIGYCDTNENENDICPHNAKLMVKFLKKHKYNVTLLTDTECKTPRHRSRSISMSPLSTSPLEDTLPARAHSTIPLSNFLYESELKEDKLPRKNIIIQNIRNMLSEKNTESIFIYFSGIGLTHPTRTKHKSVFLPLDHDIHGSISIDMLNMFIESENIYNIKMFVMFDCCFKTTDTEICGLTEIKLPEGKNIIYMTSSQQLGKTSIDECGTMTNLFIEHYTFKIPIFHMKYTINNKLESQVCEITSSFGEDCLLSL
jgi:hypothetical protein